MIKILMEKNMRTAGLSKNTKNTLLAVLVTGLCLCGNLSHAQFNPKPDYRQQMAESQALRALKTQPIQHFYLPDPLSAFDHLSAPLNSDELKLAMINYALDFEKIYVERDLSSIGYVKLKYVLATLAHSPLNEAEQLKLANHISFVDYPHAIYPNTYLSYASLMILKGQKGLYSSVKARLKSKLDVAASNPRTHNLELAPEINTMIDTKKTIDEVVAPEEVNELNSIVQEASDRANHEKTSESLTRFKKLQRALREFRDSAVRTADKEVPKLAR